MSDIRITSNARMAGAGLRIGGGVMPRLLLPFFAVVIAALLGFVVFASAPVQAQEVPTVPGVAISVTTTTATVTVEATPGCDIESLVLEYRQDASDPYTHIANGVCSDLTGNEYELTGLTANTEYYVRVSAALEGSIISTDVVTPFTTDPVAQPYVISVTVSSVTATTATFAATIGGGLGHNLWWRYRTTGVGAWAGAYEYVTTSPQTAVISGLTGNTTYELEVHHVVTSTTFSTGASRWGDSTVIKTTFTTLSSNNAPTASASATPLTVHQGDTVTLTGTASDTDAGDTLTYAWTSSAGGNFSSTTALSPTWVAPTVSSDTSITLTLTVNDGTVDTTATVSVAVTANTAPTASALATPTTLNQGGTVTLTGTASDVDSGDTLTYAWTSSAGGTFSSTTALSPTWVTPTVASDTTITLTLTVNDGTTGTSATVAVMVNAAAAPQAPTGLTLSNSFTTIDATWTAPTNTGTAAISGYHLQYRVKGTSIWSSIDLSTTGTSHSIPSLNSATTYQVQVAAKNSVGTGLYSGIGEATTGVAEGPWSSEVMETTTVSTLGQVTGLTVTSNNTSDLNVNWTDVLNADSYLVQWRKGSSGSYSQATHTPSEAAITGLGAGYTYEVRVAAKRTGYVDGSWSTIVSGTVGSLAQVSGVAVANPEYNQLVLTWDAVDGADHYTVQWGTETGTYTDSNSLEITTNTYTITGLTENLDIFIQVRGQPTLGDAGAWSTEYPTRTTLEPAAAVSGFPILSPLSSTTMSVTWGAAARADGYRVEWATTSAGLADGSVSSDTTSTNGHTITGLTANTNYWVRITSTRTDATDSLPSGSAQQRTLLAPPGAITNLSATGIDESEILVNWDDSANATSYVIQWSETSGDYSASLNTTNQATIAIVSPATEPVSNYSITSLENNKTYYIRVRATRTGGDNSAWPSEVFATTTREPPEQVIGLVLTPSSSTQINAEWGKISVADGGYTIQWATTSGNLGSNNVGEFTTTGGFNVSEHSITGLTAETEYFVRVKAHRSGTADSEWSEVESGRTFFNPPHTVGTITFSLITNTGLTVGWPNVTNADGYEIQWATSQANLGSSNVGEFIITTATNSHAITGLAPGTQYYVRIRATRTNADEAPWVSRLDTATTLGTAPSPVAGLVVNISGTTASLSWDAVTGATSYDVEYRKIGVTDVWTRSSVTNTTASITGLDLGQVYGFRVRAIKIGSSDGIWSQQVDERTNRLATLTNLRAINRGETTVTLEATLSNPDSQSTVVYLRWRTPPSGGNWQTQSVTTTGTTAEYRVTGLTPSHAYRAQASLTSGFASVSTRDFDTSTPDPSVGSVGVSNITQNSAQVSVTIDYPDSSSFPVYARQSLRGRTSYSNVLSSTGISATRTFTFQNLTPNQEYTVQVSLDDTFPSGSATASVNVRTVRPPTKKITQSVDFMIITGNGGGGVRGYREGEYGSVDPSNEIGIFGAPYELIQVSQSGGNAILRLSPCPSNWTLLAIIVDTTQIKLGYSGCNRDSSSSVDGMVATWTTNSAKGGTINKSGSIGVTLDLEFDVLPVDLDRLGPSHERSGIRGTMCAPMDMILGESACTPLLVFVPPLIIAALLLLVFGVTNPMVLGGVSVATMAGMSAFMMPNPVLIIGFIIAAAGLGALMLLIRR